ncbi:MAG: glycoside hydrolase family 3 C-terminal domain-containing protein, partial [Treponema sp.]|nr:glycoside hydrolase family 3 C-terminal domain-containing protein [Treponema sp.]
FSTALELYFGELGRGGTSSSTYTSAYANEKDLRAAQEAFAKTLVGEGTVLLKNEGGALPLAAGAKVTLLGSTVWYNAGTGSGAIANKEYGHVTPAYSLEQAGLSVNPSTTDYSGYTDAAVYIVSRVGGEGSDATLTDSRSNRYLQLRDSERAELRAIANAGFSRVIVILNTCNAMNMDFIDRAEYGIDACLWMGATGCNGLEALGPLLSAAANPSGRLVDTYLYDNTSNPAMQNFGNMVYAGTAIPYLNYVEGIYLGYKYFETRYEDVVMGTPNTGSYNYDAIVYRPFGFGLSYTDFSWSDYTLTKNQDGTVTVSITVTNTGGVAGKDVVQVYHQAPYTDYDRANNVEKAAVNLAGFAKTAILAPGASETVEISFHAQDAMKSYDANGARTYIMDEGSYYITAARDAHDAVNNILKAKGYNANGDGSFVGTYTVDAFLTLDTDFSTGAPVGNLFDDAVAQDSEYLSRKNWSRVEAGLAYTYPGTNVQNLQAHYNRNSWAASGRPASANVTRPFTTDADNGLAIKDMTGLAYDDPQWERLLDQLSITDMHNLFKRGGYTTAALESIQKERTYDFDGPAGIVNFVSGWGSFGYPSESVLAATWNADLAFGMGALVGEDALRADIQGWYAPSMNIHRSAVSGRNFEYYSEDGVISGLMAAAETQGAMSKGMYMYIKHFVINDQEENRSAVVTWLTEQSLREIYLKPFEIAIKAGGATGIMGSMNRIGYTKTVGHYPLMTSLLRGEWGFRGGNITDFATYSSSDTDQLMAAGTNLILQTSDAPLSRTNSWVRRNALRESAHQVLYMVANSIAVDAGSSGFPIYIFILIALDLIALAGVTTGEAFAVKRAIYGPPVLTDEQRKKRHIITITVVTILVIIIAVITLYFVQYYLAKQL